MWAGPECEEKAFFLPWLQHFHSSPGTRASLLYFPPRVWRMLFDIDSWACFCPWPRCAWADYALLQVMVKSLGAFPNFARHCVLFRHGVLPDIRATSDAALMSCLPLCLWRIQTICCHGSLRARALSSRSHRAVNHFDLSYLRGTFNKCHNNCKESQLHILYPQLPCSFLQPSALCCSFTSFSTLSHVHRNGQKQARSLNNVAQCERY